MDSMDIDKFFEEFKNDIQELRHFRKRLRARKTYKKRFNPLDLPDDEFRIRYRFSKENMLKIVDLLRNDLQVDIRGGGIPVELQVMAVIRYWARQEIQEDCADIHGMSQQTLSRLAQKVAIALACKSSQYIKMPSDIIEESNINLKFEDLCGMKNISGAIDCIHIKTRKVKSDLEHDFANRKGHSAISTQVVCDASLKICDIWCRWSHDASLYTDSPIKRRFEENEFVGKLVGDSHYGDSPYILTPVMLPFTESEEQYNQSHTQALNVVKMCFNVWKERFKILLEVMRGSYTTIKTTIVACAVLHNLAILYNESID